jgi:hypothetical protein
VTKKLDEFAKARKYDFASWRETRNGSAGGRGNDFLRAASFRALISIGETVGL